MIISNFLAIVSLNLEFFHSNKSMLKLKSQLLVKNKSPIILVSRTNGSNLCTNEI